MAGILGQGRTKNLLRKGEDGEEESQSPKVQSCGVNQNQFMKPTLRELSGRHRTDTHTHAHTYMHTCMHATGEEVTSMPDIPSA